MILINQLLDVSFLWLAQVIFIKSIGWRRIPVSVSRTWFEKQIRDTKIPPKTPKLQMVLKQFRRYCQKTIEDKMTIMFNVMFKVLIFMLFTDVPYNVLTAKKYLYQSDKMLLSRLPSLNSVALCFSLCRCQHEEAIVEYFPLLGVDLFGWPHAALQQSWAVHHVEVVEDHSDHGEQIKCEENICEDVTE